MHYLPHRFFRQICCTVLGLVLVLQLPTTVAASWDAAMHPATQAARDRVSGVPHYTLRGSVDVAARSVTMTQTLVWTNDTGAMVDAVPFRLFANLPDFAGRTVVSDPRIDGHSVRASLSQRDTIATLYPLHPIAPGATITVALRFTTSVPADRGQDLYGAFNDDGTTLSFASAYPLLAEYRAGRWLTEVPDTKGDLVNSPMATYDVTLTVPASHTLVSTGSDLSMVTTGTARTYRVASGLQRDFTFAVTTLPVSSTMVDGTRINLYAAADAAVQTQSALSTAARALRLFSTRYGRYPYAELDLVAVDAGSFYGVEYPGLILLQDELLTGEGARLATIVVHEVAHQWFYNLVGNDVQRDAWVDESLATYAQVIYRRAYEGPDAAAAELADLQRQYDRLIARELDGPVAQPMRDYTLYTFNVLAYAKGALFYEALAQQIGPALFDRVVAAYVRTYQYRVADGTSFARVATDVCGCAIEPLVQHWILTPMKERTP